MTFRTMQVQTRPTRGDAIRFNGSSVQAMEILQWVEEDGIGANGHLQQGVRRLKTRLYIRMAGREVLCLEEGGYLCRFARGHFSVHNAEDFAARFEVAL